MWQPESWRSGEGRKKERLIQLLHESSAATCLVCLHDVFLCHAFNVSQSDFTGNEYIFS